jgi:hypothetical protein
MSMREEICKTEMLPITSPKKIGSMSIPQLHLQVKSTSIKTLTDDKLRYRLKVKNYEERSIPFNTSDFSCSFTAGNSG